MKDLSTALLVEIANKVKAAKKRHHKVKWTDRDIDPFFFIAERLLLRNPAHDVSKGTDRNKEVNRMIQDWRNTSAMTFETHSVSNFCLEHATKQIKKKKVAALRKKDKQRKRDARNAQKRRSSGFYQGGMTPRTPRSNLGLSPRATGGKEITGETLTDKGAEEEEEKAAST